MSTINNPSMKRVTQFRVHVHSIRQKSYGKWKNYSNLYSKVLIRFSWSILSLALLLSVGLTVCFFMFMNIRVFDQNDFITDNGRAMQNAFQVRNIFGNDTEFRMHQQLYLYPGLDIIIKRKVNEFNRNENDTNMLDNNILQEVRALDARIQSIQINDTNNFVQYNYTSLCTKQMGACMVDGNYILTAEFSQSISRLHPPKNKYYIDYMTGANGVPGFMFGKNHREVEIASNNDYIETETEEQSETEDETNQEQASAEKIIESSTERIFSYVPLLRLRYSLSSSTAEKRQLSINWEREALRYLIEEYKSDMIELSASTSTALVDAVTKKAHDEGLYPVFLVVIYFTILCIFLCIEGNFHTSVGYLPLCGLISIALSTGATFGLISIFRIQIIEPMMLLVFIITLVDCARFSIVCGEYHRIIKEHLSTITDVTSHIDIEKILPSIMESTHPHFIVSTLIISLIYVLISIFSQIPVIAPICVTLALYAFVNYIMHLTFFSSCLVITLKRISSRRHCLFCCRLPKDYYTKNNPKSNGCLSLKCKMCSQFNISSFWKKIFANALCSISLVFLILSLYCTFSIDTRLYEDKLLPRNATAVRSYMQSQIDEFDVGPVIMFTIPQTVDYEENDTRIAIEELLKQCRNKTRTNDFSLSWLDTEIVASIVRSNMPLENRISPFSAHDLIVSKGQSYSTITASRVYCQTNSIIGDSEDIRVMDQMYAYASQSSIPGVFPYSTLYSSFDALRQMRIELSFLIFALMLCSFVLTFISFLSLKHSLLVTLHLTIQSVGTLACFYLFENMTFNFVNGPWLYAAPILFIDIIIHSSYYQVNSKWKYNRITVSMMIAALFLYLFPIQTYVYRIIRSSLLYQSIICFIWINSIIPSWYYLFPSIHSTDQVDADENPPVIIITGNQPLANGTEVNHVLDEVNKNIEGSV